VPKKSQEKAAKSAVGTDTGLMTMETSSDSVPSEHTVAKLLFVMYKALLLHVNFLITAEVPYCRLLELFS